MAQTGKTPISLYYSTTGGNTPTAGNLVDGELAINTADGKLFYKDSSGVVQTIASKAGNVNVSSFSGGTTGLTPNTATTGAVTLAGTLAVANGGTGSTTSTGSGSVVLQTSPSITTPTIDKINTSVTNTSLGAGNASIMKNRIINGAMVIDQRYAGTATANTINGYTLDRWKIDQSASTGKLIVQQNAGSVTPPAGFTNYLGVTSQSSYSVAAGDEYLLTQNVEGYNIADLGWGSANAKTITVSFWVRSSLTGSFGGSIGNSSGTRFYPFSYTISSANTWEQKSVTIAGDTSGTWLTTNGTGLYLRFGLGVGTTYGSGTAGAWTGTYADVPTGSVSVVGTNGATFYITGVQLEVGSSATGYEYENYTQTLQKCQRYFTKFNANTSPGSGNFMTGVVNNATNEVRVVATLPTTMRTDPTFSYLALRAYDGGVAPSVNAIFAQGSSPTNGGATLGVSASTLTIGRGVIIIENATNAYVSFSAEL